MIDESEERLEQRERLAMGTRNKLKLGLFSANASNGRIPTLVPERWSGNWRDNLALAQMSDDAGLDFLLPLGRWKGYGGVTDHQGASFETITWATGLLAATKRITIFGTVHVPLFHPVIAAKQMVTADWVGSGRFGLNLVCGSNVDEFDMLGIDLKAQAEKYEQGQEWLDAIKRMWTEEEDFDLHGRYYHLSNVRSKPKPYGGSRPIIMNAGASPTGKAFALRNCDAYFTGVRLESIDPSTGKFTPAIEAATEHVRAIRSQAGGIGREVGVFTRAEIVCRPSAREAEEYYHYAVDEQADWGAIDHRLARNAPPDESAEAFQRRRRDHIHAFPIIGTPDDVARELARVSAAGFDGLALGFVNYLAELPYFRDEVLPRLERMGLRTTP
jgi:alkanesulfonate monooxygenase SsuD/methylene tetrahydromethanopterin reductase-like flavin-dependent oxidoreductase (luciferase family)